MPKINMAKKTSYIWQHYKIIDHHNARCNVCNKRLSYKTSISNLKKHLSLKHPSVGGGEDSSYTIYPSTPTHDNEDDEDNNDHDNNYDDDAEDVKTLLGLSSAQVDKTIEIIEEVHNGNHIVFHNDNNEERVIRKKAKPALKKYLKALEKKIKKEPSSSTPDAPSTVIKNRDNAIEVLTQNIGNKLRKMSEKQAIIAEYKIHEILFFGLNNQLKNPIDDSHHNNMNYSMSGMNTVDSVPDAI